MAVLARDEWDSCFKGVVQMSTTNTQDPRAKWSPARLFPTVGIKGEIERERRATEALLAVMHAVPSFGLALIRKGGAPKGRVVETFTEVQIPGTGKGAPVLRPDGAAVVRAPRAGEWSCLIEVKTGGAVLTPEQVGDYLTLAEQLEMNAVLTITNQIAEDPTVPPVQPPPRPGRKAAKAPSLFHLSWWRILAEAVVEHQHRGVSDPDQAWILEEFIAFLEDERSGTGGFGGWGREWVTVRENARTQTLDPRSQECVDAVARWDEFADFLALRLYRDLGSPATVSRPKGMTTMERRGSLADELASSGRLPMSLRVPGALGGIDLIADLRTRQVQTSVDIPAPEERVRPKARITWLLRQLRDVNEPMVSVEAVYPRKTRATASLVDAQEDPERLLHPSDPRQLPRSFRVSTFRDMGQKRGTGKGSFMAETSHQVLDFYRDVVQVITPLPKRPPQLAADSSAPRATESVTTAQADGLPKAGKSPFDGFIRSDESP